MAKKYKSAKWIHAINYAQSCIRLGFDWDKYFSLCIEAPMHLHIGRKDYNKLRALHLITN